MGHSANLLPTAPSPCLRPLGGTSGMPHTDSVRRVGAGAGKTPSPLGRRGTAGGICGSPPSRRRSRRWLWRRTYGSNQNPLSSTLDCYEGGRGSSRVESLSVASEGQQTCLPQHGYRRLRPAF